jgi:nickel-type superoxide dismutase maturation protease
VLTFPKNFLSLSPIVKYQVSGSSMIPTIAAGETVFVNRLSYLFRNPHIDDIIAFHDPRDGKVLIKRIIKIANRCYFVQGDNKNASTDSRVFGMIRRQEIIGKVIL